MKGRGRGREGRKARGERERELRQLLEDLAEDLRLTFRRIAARRRPSPVVRRLAVAMTAACHSIERDACSAGAAAAAAAAAASGGAAADDPPPRRAFAFCAAFRVAFFKLVRRRATTSTIRGAPSEAEQSERSEPSEPPEYFGACGRSESERAPAPGPWIAWSLPGPQSAGRHAIRHQTPDFVAPNTEFGCAQDCACRAGGLQGLLASESGLEGNRQRPLNGLSGPARSN
jgi:hypothetical protein